MADNKQEPQQKRPEELGFGAPPYLHLVSVDFEASRSWVQLVAAEGRGANRPAFSTDTRDFDAYRWNTLPRSTAGRGTSPGSSPR